MKLSKMNETTKAWISLAAGMLFYMSPFFVLSQPDLTFPGEYDDLSTLGFVAIAIAGYLLVVGYLLVGTAIIYFAGSILKLKATLKTALKAVFLIFIIGVFLSSLVEILKLGLLVDFIVGFVVTMDILRRIYKINYKKALFLMLVSALLFLVLFAMAPIVFSLL